MKVPRVVVGLLAVMIIGMCVVAGLGFRKLERQDAQVGELVSRLDAEIEARDVQSCESAKVVRVEQQDLLEFFAAGRPAFLAEVHRYYDGLPAPADCGP